MGDALEEWRATAAETREMICRDLVRSPLARRVLEAVVSDPRMRSSVEHEFMLAIQGDLEAEGRLDALFEAGCDDASIGSIDGTAYAEFVREAPTFEEAVASAIRQVESVAGLTVLRVEPDDTLSNKHRRPVRMVMDDDLLKSQGDNYTPRTNEVRGVSWERHATGWHAELGLMTLEVEDSGEWMAAYDGDSEAGAADDVQIAKRDCVEMARSMHRMGLAALDCLVPVMEEREDDGTITAES